MAWSVASLTSRSGWNTCASCTTSWENSISQYLLKIWLTTWVMCPFILSVKVCPLFLRLMSVLIVTIDADVSIVLCRSECGVGHAAHQCGRAIGDTRQAGRPVRVASRPRPHAAHGGGQRAARSSRGEFLHYTFTALKITLVSILIKPRMILIQLFVLLLLLLLICYCF